MHPWLPAAVTAVLAAGAAGTGTVKLPLQEWEAMLQELEDGAQTDRPRIPYGPVERRIDAEFRRGVLAGRMRATFEVLDGERHVNVPVIDGAVALGDVRLDGRRTSLAKEGSFYAVGVAGRGAHELTVEFFVGREQDRFARRSRFSLPPAGATHFVVLLPEVDIEPRLTRGVIRTATAVRAGGQGGATRIEGALDASGLFDLAWNRKVTHRVATAATYRAECQTLIAIADTIVTGRARFDLDVEEGELDRVLLQVPATVEVVRAEGPAVLQWQTDPRDPTRLTVLFRHLVEGSTHVTVQYQYPWGEAGAAEVPLRLVHTAPEVPLTGHAGVNAPASLDVQAASHEGAELLTVRDLPAQLADASQTPLLFGFAYTAPPTIVLRTARHDEVEVSTTLIDELQASTVVIEDGTEVTKMKLRVRNNTRQYLAVRLAGGSELTYARIDGDPVRPALGGGEAGGGAGSEAGGGDEGGGAGAVELLFPLRQSERVAGEQVRSHVVAAGETLSDIANRYYSDPSAWRRILEANELLEDDAIAPGQVLHIPAQEANVRESAFVIELAYKRLGPRLAPLGARTLRLPALDVDTVRATWHLYLPESREPVRFTGNLQQYSSIRYDPLRRLQHFLQRARFTDDAWAGDAYKNILSQRRVIYRSESGRKQRSAGVLGSFPLVGDRYRFKRVLLGNEAPEVTVVWAAPGVQTVVRWLAFLAAVALASIVLRPGATARQRWAAAAAVCGLLLVAHYVLGVHRRLVWGADVALLVAWARLAGGASLTATRARLVGLALPAGWYRARRVLGLAAICLAVWILRQTPLLLSCLALGLLAVAWWRAQRATTTPAAPHGPPDPGVQHA